MRSRFWTACFLVTPIGRLLPRAPSSNIALHHKKDNVDRNRLSTVRHQNNCDRNCDWKRGTIMSEEGIFRDVRYPKVTRAHDSSQPLLTPYRMGDLNLPNRVVMAPLTRMRAQTHDHVPTDLQAEYYAQRASAGLIITEATAVSPQGFGWADTPGLWTEEQVRGWRRVTDAVHAAGGRIISQLWHTGAISHPELLAGAEAVSRPHLG